MSVIDGLVEWNRSRREVPPATGPHPSRRLAILTCMDARIDPARLFGVEPGDAHVIRNAGAVVTDDVVRSLLVSQSALGTRAVVVIAHTSCGMEGLDEAMLVSELEAGTGWRADQSFGGFEDVRDHVRESVRRLRSHPGLRGEVRGFVLDITTGALDEVHV